MNLEKHCSLCEHRLRDDSRGVFCGLTGLKPDFEGQCGKIEFGEKLKELVRTVNIERYKVTSTKLLTIGNFVVFLTIALLFITAGIWYLNRGWENGIIYTPPFFIIGIGILVLPKAFGPVNKYRRNSNISKEKKLLLDELLTVYSIRYSIDITVKEDVHGNKEYIADIKFLRK